MLAFPSSPPKLRSHASPGPPQSGRLRFSSFRYGRSPSAASNAVAVLRGLVRPIDTFVRTPKQGLRATPPRTPLPRLEHFMALFTLACVMGLAGRPPLAMAGYAFFCAAGFWALTVYWWVVERRRSEP